VTNLETNFGRRMAWLRLSDRILAGELYWPLPLLALGVLGIFKPGLALPALVLALVPWPARWVAWGRPSAPAFLACPLGLLALGAGLGLVVAYDRALSWPMLLTLLGSLALFFAIVNWHGSPEHLAGGLVLAAGLAALYFVGQYSHFDYHEGVGRVASVGRITGSLLPDLGFFQPPANAMAGFLEGTLLLALVLAWRARTWLRWGWGLAALLIAYALLISGSRGAWVGLAVAVGIGVWLLVPRRALRLALAGLAVAGGLLIVPAGYLARHLLEAGSPVPVLSSALNTATSRFELYRNSLNLLADYPLTGIGLGDTFTMVYSRYQLLIPVPYLSYAHNLFLAVALGLGLLGLAGLVWLLISFYRFVIRVERAALEPEQVPIFRAAWLGASVTFVHGLVDSPQFSHSRWTMPLLFALLGLSILIGRPALSPLSRPARPRAWRWATGGTLVLGLIVAGLVIPSPLAAAWQANLGALVQTRAELNPGLDVPARQEGLARAAAHFQRALSLDPAQPTANRRLGMIALDRADFPAAAAYLERAYAREPANQATLKALGYAYMWTGRLDAAERLFRQVDFASQLRNELDYYRWSWSRQGQDDLASYADDMARRLDRVY
jgi:O-antigen ligase